MGKRGNKNNRLKTGSSDLFAPQGRSGEQVRHEDIAQAVSENQQVFAHRKIQVHEFDQFDFQPVDGWRDRVSDFTQDAKRRADDSVLEGAGGFLRPIAHKDSLARSSSENTARGRLITRLSRIDSAR